MFPKMSCFWALLIVFLSFAIINTPSQSKPLNHHHHHHKSHSVVIGTVYSPSCLQLKNLPKPTHYFVTVECWKETGSKWRFRQVVKTDNHGGFRLHLHFPFLFTKCCFTNNDNNPPTCTHPRLVASRRDGTHVVSAGLLALTCSGQGKNSKKISQFSNPSEAFLPPILGSFLPPLPQLPPLPSLPRLPPLPGIPFMPPMKRAAKPSENLPEIFPFPPNPFNVPILQAPPLTIPPIFPLPDSPPLFNLPPLPSLIQPPQPPPPPALPPPLQLPPFPFQPTPGFPGVPPTRKNYSP